MDKNRSNTWELRFLDIYEQLCRTFRCSIASTHEDGSQWVWPDDDAGITEHLVELRKAAIREPMPDPQGFEDMKAYWASRQKGQDNG